ncbi:MAG: 50S ribosomal protein L23 [Clostridia bacterium]|nr:50S ribosomal protein L23 [Clostridia bacterium]
MNNYDIIIRPHKSEKTTADIEKGKYTFIVAEKATKIDVKKAVEDLFGVRVLSVNTIRYDGKKKVRHQNSGVVEGRTVSYKKAIVKIDLNANEETYLGKGGKTVKSGKKVKNIIEGYAD